LFFKLKNTSAVCRLNAFLVHRTAIIVLFSTRPNYKLRLSTWQPRRSKNRTATAQASFDACRQPSTDTPRLYIAPEPGHCAIRLATGASNIAVGAVLGQNVSCSDGQWQPLGFFYRKTYLPPNKDPTGRKLQRTFRCVFERTMTSCTLLRRAPPVTKLTSQLPVFLTRLVAATPFVS